MVLDPITGVNRFITGDSSRVSDKPAEFVPSTLGGFTAAGVLWRGSQTRAFNSTGDPFLEMDLLYGDPKTGEQPDALRRLRRAPALRRRLDVQRGQGSRAVCAAMPLGGDKLQFSVLQSYDFQSNDVYSTGSQSFDGSLGFLQTAVEAQFHVADGLGWAHGPGRRRFAAADITERPEEEETRRTARECRRAPGTTTTAPAETSARPRRCAGMVGPSSHSPTRAAICTPSTAFARITSCSAPGRRRLPLRGRLGFGGSGEYFIRNTYYQDAARTVKKFHYPQLRAYFTWRLS